LQKRYKLLCFLHCFVGAGALFGGIGAILSMFMLFEANLFPVNWIKRWHRK